MMFIFYVNTFMKRNTGPKTSNEKCIDYKMARLGIGNQLILKIINSFSEIREKTTCKK